MAARLVDGVLAGDPRAIARAISLVEDEAPAASALMAGIFPRTGRAYSIGVTGAPGAGKSTLVDRLIVEARREGLTVGVVAVDPTSPFTGGAVLGDRVRMVSHAGDSGVFIRSMATRGHLGGLSPAASDVALILDASGKDLVIIETVGVGQGEVDIVRTADVSVVLLVPGTGDDVQALKAGVMEIADIFVVNKADREGADRVVQAVAATLALQTFAAGEWQPPIVQTEAQSGAGVSELWAALRRFRDEAAGARPARQRARQETRLRELLARRFLQHAEQTLAPGELERLAEAIAERTIDPYAAADDVLNRLMTPGRRPSAAIPTQPGLLREPRPPASRMRGPQPPIPDPE